MKKRRQGRRGTIKDQPADLSQGVASTIAAMREAFALQRLSQLRLGRLSRQAERETLALYAKYGPKSSMLSDTRENLAKRPRVGRRNQK